MKTCLTFFFLPLSALINHDAIGQAVQHTSLLLEFMSKGKGRVFLQLEQTQWVKWPEGLPEKLGNSPEYDLVYSKQEENKSTSRAIKKMWKQERVNSCNCSALQFK